MTANIEVSSLFDLAAISIASGQPDPEQRWYENGRLFVAGVTQESLDAALDTYDPVQGERDRLALLIAARRYTAEIAGVTVGSIRVDTDDRSKLLINGAAVEAMLNPAYVLRWKADGVFVDLDADQVKDVARAVRAYVQACFDREDALLTALNAGTFTESMLEEGWPS
ncbi:DUF4376 domain-containing protein [Pseudomonas resinovorans]|uniref:DUF4376 domain-containing protein n=1 Tax=Metapseudomonas resinovorans TaxID=53412 RepID=A0ABT4Y8L9_METRE|nr:DUF4376 domain-containing protein [Pseudomonas resinovorans]MDA8485174.1 DUF4376 domain-containing protein [Pseudomonas resinovorans]